VQHEAVDEPVAATTGGVLGPESVPEQVGYVIASLQVAAGHEIAPDPAGTFPIGVQDHSVLGREQGTGTEKLPGPPGVVRYDQVEMSARRSVPREPKGPGSERRQYPPLGWNTTTAGSLAHMLTMAVATTMDPVASSAR
jgi:hypothetical protein